MGLSLRDRNDWNRGGGIRALSVAAALALAVGADAQTSPREILAPVAPPAGKAPDGKATAGEATAVEGKGTAPAGDRMDFSVVRSRRVTVAAAAFKDVATSGGGTVRFNLFDDFAVNVVFDRVAGRKAPDEFTLIGHVEGQPLATAVLVQNKEATVADIRMPNGDTYQIRYRGNGVHEVLKTAEDRQPAGGAGGSM